VTATRTAQVANKKGAIKIVIDFEGGELDTLDSPDELEAVISAGPQAVLKKYQLIKNVVTNGWRLVFQIDPEEGPWTEGGGDEGVIELRTFLKKGDSVLTETWSYGVQP
jgi:glucans biosynthesis protein